MKNLLKITAISSLLVIACFLISACGSGGTENFVQGNGKIIVTATDSVTQLALSGVQVQVRKNSVTDPTVISSATTDSLGSATLQETIATDYFLTFVDTRTPAVYASQNYINNPVQSTLTTTTNIAVAMVPL